MLGYSEEEVLGWSAEQLATEDGFESIRAATDRRVEGISGSYETEFVTKDGKKVNVIISASPMMDEESNYLGSVAVATDITEQKKMEEMEEFLHSLLRHDLKNKSQITLGYLELMKEELGDEKEVNFLDKSIESCQNSLDLIQKVKKLMETEKTTETYPVNLNEQFNAALEEHIKMAYEKGFEIEVGDINGNVIGGPLLEELFSNLIGNAMIHSDGSKLKVTSYKRDEGIIVSIEDDGRGIPDGKKDKIFNRGYKRTGSKRSGLGTYIVKRIVDIYGGRIEVDDSDLGGARFEVYLKKAE